jgi:DNA-binding beta-propeller fold protein YncE
MLWLLSAFALVLGACAQPAILDGPAPTLRRTIPLEGVSGRIDHFAYDPGTGRVFVAALENGSLEVIDLEKGQRVKSIAGLQEPQGAVCVPRTKEVVVACGGDGTAHAYDTSTLEERAKSEVGDDADNARLSSDGKSVIIGHSGGALAVLDPATLKKTGEVKLSGHPESFQLEPGSKRVFVNVPGGAIGGGGEVDVADLSTQNVTATWKLKEAGRNFPMALDAAHKRLYVGCRRSAKLLVVDADSGKTVASPECVGDADDVFVDTKTGRVLVVGGEGAIDMFETKDQQSYTKTASVKTVDGARTGLLIPEKHVLLVAVPKRSGHQAEIREYALPD